MTATGTAFLVLLFFIVLVSAQSYRGFYAMGDNRHSQTTIYFRSPNLILSNISAIASSPLAYHRFALTKSGQVYAWGIGADGVLCTNDTITRYSPVLLESVENIISISIGDQQSYLVNSTGHILGPFIGIGDGISRLTPTLLSANSTFLFPRKIAASGASFVITQNGDVYGWGQNAYYELGLGDTTSRATPEFLPLLIDIIDISACGTGTLALDKYGMVYSFGTGNFGKLGQGFITQMTIPTLISSLSNIVDISMGLEHSIVVDSVDEVYVFGSNAEGELCQGTSDGGSRVPIKMTQLTGIRSGVAGASYSLFITKSAELYVCGKNQQGSLGLSHNVGKLSPVPNPFMNSVFKTNEISATSISSYFLNDRSDLWGSGEDISSILGIDYTKPIQMDTFSNTISVSCGGDDIVLSNSDGKSFGLGSNVYSKLGTGNGNPVFSLFQLNVPPVQLIETFFTTTIGIDLHGRVHQVDDVSGLFEPMTQLLNDTIINVSSGVDHELYRGKEGNVWVRGSNQRGQLGINSTTFRPVPVNNHLLSNITQVGTGFQFSVVLDSFGQMYTFGLNDRGQLGNSLQGVQSILPIQPLNITGIVQLGKMDSRSKFVLVLANTSEVWSWGDNLYGQLGLGDLIMRSRPTLVAGLLGKNITEIALGITHFLAVSREGLVYSAGRNEFGELGIGDRILYSLPQLVPIMNAKSVSVGGQTSVILNQCPVGFTGPLCKDFLCFGVPSTRVSTVCSGLGRCVGVESCQCDPPSFGNNCQNKVFHWVSNSLNGDWNTLTNWGVKRLDLLDPAQSIPSSGDTVYLDRVGVMVIHITSSVSLTSIHVGSEKSNVSLIIGSGEVSVSEDFSIHSLSSVTIGKMSAERTLAADVVSNGIIARNLLIDGSLRIFVSSLISAPSILLNGQMSTSSNDVVTVSGANFTISMNGSLSIDSVGLLSASNSQIFNYGRFSMGRGSIATSFTNFGTLIIEGMRNVTNLWTGLLLTEKDSNIVIRNSNVIFRPSLNITAGSVRISGILDVPLFTYESQDGLFRLEYPHRLEIIGNATFTEQSTVFLVINGTSFGSSDVLNVTGTLKMNPLLLLKTGSGFTPAVDDLVSILSFGNIEYPSFETMNLIGAPYKNAEFVDRGYFKIVLSVGSSQGYKCNNLGNQKILEMTRFDNARRVVFSLTTPQRDDKWIGFGYGRNSSLSGAVMTASRGDLIVEIANHNESLGKSLITSATTLSQTIFLIGPLYRTITLVTSMDDLNSDLNSQKLIYYAELSQNTNNSSITSLFDSKSHYSETYEFDILNGQETPCTNLLQPLRSEIYHPAAYSVVLFIYLVLMLLCVIFYKFRPLVTRGISPILTILLLSIQLLLEFKNLSEISSFQGSLCFYYSFAVYPLQQLTFIMILLYFCRYFGVISFNEYKKSIYNRITLGKTVEASQRVRMRLLKILASTPLLFTVLIGSYLIVVGIFFIVIAADSFVCHFKTLIVLKTINNIELIIIYSMTLGTFIIDVIGNWKLVINFKWIEYVFYKDPYWFRAQMILFVPFMIYTLIVEIYLFATNLDYVGIVRTFWIGIALNTVTCAILLCIDVVFPLSITIITLLLRICQRKVVSSLNVQDIIANEETYPLFFAFCESEFSLENISGYNDIRQFRLNVSVESAQSFYSKYLNGNDSVMEINIPQKVALVIKDAIAKGEVTAQLLDKVDSELVSNLSDTFSRFTVSREYLQYLASKARQKEMIEKI